jgi:hypothetical protein
MSSSSASRVRVERTLSPSGRAGDQADRQSVTSKPMTLRVNSRRSSASLPRRRRGRAKPTNGRLHPRRDCVKVTFDRKLPESAFPRRQQAAKRRRVEAMLGHIPHLTVMPHYFHSCSDKIFSIVMLSFSKGSGRRTFNLLLKYTSIKTLS